MNAPQKAITIIGTYCGGNAAHLLSEAHLRLVFAAMLIWLGLRDLRGAAQKRLALTATAATAE